MASKRFPFTGIPSGWFCVAFSDELGPGQIHAARYFGRDLVVYRTASGRACVADAYCPHLGGHLGQGSVVGEQLRCCFHGFEFDCAGNCVATPYDSDPPARAKLEQWPVREMGGAVLVWHDALGKPPSWTVPELDTTGWTPLRGKRLELRSHPQETSENSVDLGHFTVVHGFASARIERRVETDGPLLTASYSVERMLDLIGLPERTVHVDFDVEVHGLGYSMVLGRVPRFGITFRNLVLATPVDEDHIHLRIGTAVRELRWWPLTRLAHRIAFGGLSVEVSRDLPIWERKAYQPRPALARGDGPIGLYRQWARQFYPPAPAEAAAPAASLAAG